MMTTFSFVSWIILYISTNTNADCELTCSNMDEEMEDVVSALTDFGYNVDKGYFEVYDPETTNLHIPFAKSDTDYLISQFDGTPYVRFGGQDSIVFRTCTPANVKYFGYRSYSAARITNQNNDNTPTEYTILEASLGDTLNHKVISTESSDITSFNSPFDRKTSFVTTGDEQTWTDVVTAFTNVNLLNEMSINLDGINNGILSKLGIGWFKYSQSELDIPRDSISIVYRIEWNETSECIYNKEQYLNQSFPFYRFYKNSKQPRCPINRKLRDTKDSNQICENTPENKYYFDSAVTNIIEYIKKEYNYKFISNVPLNDNDGSCLWFEDWWPPNHDEFVYIFSHGFYCILYQKDCMFDNRDTYYSWDGTDHQLNDNDFYLIVGLNHNNYSMSTVNSISLSIVTNKQNGNSFEIFDTISNTEYSKYNLANTIKCNKEIEHKSRFHSHKNAQPIDKHDCTELKNMFAIQVTRPQNCINSDIIPSMCPSNDILDIDDRFIFFAEATLNPKTKTMPDSECLIEWRLLKFKACNT